MGRQRLCGWIEGKQPPQYSHAQQFARRHEVAGDTDQ